MLLENIYTDKQTLEGERRFKDGYFILLKQLPSLCEGGLVIQVVDSHTSRMHKTGQRSDLIATFGHYSQETIVYRAVDVIRLAHVEELPRALSGQLEA